MAKGRSSATPLAAGDRLYVGTELRSRGGPDDGGGFLFAVKTGGSGDITPPKKAGSTEFVAWRTAKSGIQMASPVLCRGHIYLLERRFNIVHCIDAETGEKVYRTRIPGSRAFWASPWTCGDRVYCLDSSGTTFVLAGGSKFRVLRQNVIDERAWSTPATANGVLFLRTIGHLYCIANSDR
jgi:outer membrane protein assembly factor BamB